MKKIILLHYKDKTKYPPLLNVLRYLESKECVYILITGNFNSRFLARYNYLNYFLFTIKSVFRLITSKGSIVYFESISAIPIRLYFLFFPFSKRKLVIHFHEYFSNEEYQRQSFFEKLGRRLEVKLFKRAKWISHTNNDRLALFKKEFPFLTNDVLRAMPNYPYQSWQKQQHPRVEKHGKIKLLHIGSISTKGMYLTELLNEFGSHPNYTIDFYSHKFTDEVKTAIQLHDNCVIHGAIDYQDIPKLKGIYDVGLVLYKGLSLNFTYNAPNKVFEYLALDLDVWCSDKLITAKQHERTDCYPKMLMVNFEKLAEFDWQAALNREGLEYVPSPYVCEQVYEKLIEELSK